MLKAEILKAILRHGMTALGGILALYGILPDSESLQFAEGAAQIVGGILALAGLSWSIQRKIQRALPATPVTPAKHPNGK